MAGSAQAFIEAKRVVEETAEKFDDAKQELMALAKHTSERSAGVVVTRFWRARNICYRKVP